MVHFLQNLWGCLSCNPSVSEFKPVQLRSMGTFWLIFYECRNTHTQERLPETPAQARVLVHTHTHTHTVPGSLLVSLDTCKPYMFTSSRVLSRIIFLDCYLHLVLIAKVPCRWTGSDRNRTPRLKRAHHRLYYNTANIRPFPSPGRTPASSDTQPNCGFHSCSEDCGPAVIIYLLRCLRKNTVA